MLYAPIASKSCKKPICFARMTGIGPMTSADPAEWATYSTEAAARQSSAMLHPLTVLEVRPIGDLDEGEAT